MPNSTKTLDKLGETTETVFRKSRQNDPIPSTFMTTTLNWVKKLEMVEPTWGTVRAGYTDNRIRDEWLQMIGRAEPHLNGVINTAITLDANRQYRLVGGRNQVKRFVDKFRNFDDGLGFKTMQTLNATNYYNSDIGSPVEIETEGKNGPLLSLYHTDPTRLRLGKGGKTLKYDGGKKGIETWKSDQFYRLVSQRSTQDKLNGLGFSAVSRCVKLAQIMIAVNEHNLEKLQQIAAKGILFIQSEDLTQESWDEAQNNRQVIREANTGNAYYDDVMVIVDRAAKGDMMALSELPERFDPFMFTDYMMKGYALAFGRPVRAFWSLNSGNFGGGTETKVQSEQATYGGAAEFILSSQEQIQNLLPDSLLFEYEVENTGGKLEKATLDELLIKAANELIPLGITTDQAQEWLADHGVIPSEWTIAPVEVADNGVMKNRILETDNIQRALENNPDEPIVMYNSDGNKTTVLWKNKRDAFGKSWRVSRDIKKKRTTIEDYEGGNRGNFMVAAATEAYLEDNDDRTDDEEEAYLLALAMLNGQESIDDENTDDLLGLLEIFIPISVLAALLLLRQRSEDATEDSIELRAALWNTQIEYFRQLGILGANLDLAFTWHLGDTEHCDTCLSQEGLSKTGREWLEGGILPQSDVLDCGGFYCQCILDPDQ